jgi:hypothetical protein
MDDDIEWEVERRVENALREEAIARLVRARLEKVCGEFGEHDLEGCDLVEACRGRKEGDVMQELHSDVESFLQEKGVKHGKNNG